MNNDEKKPVKPEHIINVESEEDEERLKELMKQKVLKPGKVDADGNFTEKNAKKKKWLISIPCQL